MIIQPEVQTNELELEAMALEIELELMEFSAWPQSIYLFLGQEALPFFDLIISFGNQLVALLQISKYLYSIFHANTITNI